MAAPLRARDRVIEKPPSLFVIVWNSVGPDDDHVVELLVFCLLNCHSHKPSAPRHAMSATRGEPAVEVSANLIRSNFLEAQNASLPQNPFFRRFQGRNTDVRFEGNKRISDGTIVRDS